MSKKKKQGSPLKGDEEKIRYKANRFKTDVGDEDEHKNYKAYKRDSSCGKTQDDKEKYSYKTPEFKQKSKENFERFLNETHTIYDTKSSFNPEQSTFSRIDPKDVAKFKALNLSEEKAQEYSKFKKKRIKKAAEFELDHKTPFNVKLKSGSDDEVMLNGADEIETKNHESSPSIRITGILNRSSEGNSLDPKKDKPNDEFKIKSDGDKADGVLDIADSKDENESDSLAVYPKDKLKGRENKEQTSKNTDTEQDIEKSAEKEKKPKEKGAEGDTEKNKKIKAGKPAEKGEENSKDVQREKKENTTVQAAKKIRIRIQEKNKEEEKEKGGEKNTEKNVAGGEDAKEEKNRYSGTSKRTEAGSIFNVKSDKNKEEVDIEYETRADKEQVSDYLKSETKGLFIQTISLGILFFITLMWHFLVFVDADIPSILSPVNPICYLFLNLLAVGIGGYFGFEMIATGVRSVLHGKINRESVVFASFLIDIVLNVCLFFSNGYIALDTNIFLLTPLPIGCFFCLSLSEYLTYKSACSDFDCIVTAKKFYCLMNIENKKTSYEFTKGTVDDSPKVGYLKPASFIKDFVKHELTGDVCDKVTVYILPISLGISAVLSVLFFIYSLDIFLTLTFFTALFCGFICFPICISTSIFKPRLRKKSQKYGVRLFGSEFAFKFGDINAITVPARVLFLKDHISLEGMKAFNKKSIYDSIICTASILDASGSVLNDMFLRIMRENNSYLKKTSDIKYEDNLGLSGIVDGKQIYVGNLEMMKTHNIYIPSDNKTQNFNKPNCETIYVAISGTLCAAFIFSILPAKKTKQQIDALTDAGVRIIVKSVDPFLTAKSLSRLFLTDENTFKILPQKYHKTFDSQSKLSGCISSPVINNGSFDSFIQSVLLSKKFSKVSVAFVILAVMSVLIQSAVFVILAFTANMFQVSAVPIAAIQILTVVIIYFMGLFILS